MEKKRFLLLFLTVLVSLKSYGAFCSPEGIQNQVNKDSTPKDRITGYFEYTMDRFHANFDVYTDLGAAGNHFPHSAKVWDGLPETLIVMDPCCTINPYAGSTCIECKFSNGKYGGYVFLNGTMSGSQKTPAANWGDTPNAGFNLSGATQVTFYARGKNGGEKVEFYVGGVGWGTDFQGNSTKPEKPYPDSFPKVRTGVITLNKQWRKYQISLRKKDLSYVLDGFGWVATDDVTFYLDEIKWDKSRLSDLRFLTSFETNPAQEDFERTMKAVAFSYDNSLVLLAFLTLDTTDSIRRATQLADGFVHAIYHDRYYDGPWLRNAYSSGDLVVYPGWIPNNRTDTVRMPGFWNCTTNQWLEDEFQVSLHTGNVGWVIISLVSAYQVLGKDDYLNAAKNLAEFVETHFKDSRGNGGYIGGYGGWEGNTTRLKYKSLEHNLDLYVVFQRLYEITTEIKWRQRALHAKTFINSMWDSELGCFYTGTGLDGVTTNKDVIPLDAQTWAILALRDETQIYLRCLEYAEKNHKLGKGFDFNTDKDGIWYEGTGQMGVAYKLVGEMEKAEASIQEIQNAQLESGAIPAASKNGLTTGFYLSDGSPWVYYRYGHIGASAWYLFAKSGVNPYWIGSGSGATISLSTTRLNYGYTIGGAEPASQTVMISNWGAGVMSWNVSSDTTWLKYTPAASLTPGPLTVSVDPSDLNRGTYYATINVSSADAGNSPQSLEVNLKVIEKDQDEPPFGIFATPLDGASVSSSISVTGWCLDDTGVQSVTIYLEQNNTLTYIGDAVMIDGARPDVAAEFPDYPNYTKAGWGYMLLTNFLPGGGNGIYALRVIARDRMGHTTSLGTKTIHCDNRNAVKPFGAIDTPSQGGTASGGSFINWGWVLTPQPDMIPTDGTSINVYVDSVNIGHPTYNIYRADIANFFPGYENSEGAIGYFYLDTTSYQNGVHTIQWTATNDAGNTDGIGSRYFTINNAGSDSAGRFSRFSKITSNLNSISKRFGLPVDCAEPIKIKRGFNNNIEPVPIISDENGVSRVKIRELELLELRFSTEKADVSGYMTANNRFYPLPLGSTLGNGVFLWAPGPGFIGDYGLIFVEKRQNGEFYKMPVIIEVVPKYTVID